MTVRPIVSGFCTDLRQSWRVLARARGSALAVIALVGLGMAGVLALFGPLYSAVFAPLPFPHSEQLVRIGRGVPVFQRDTDELIRPEYMRRVFSGVTAYASDPGPMDAGLIERDARPQWRIQRTSCRIFSTLSACGHGWATTFHGRVAIRGTWAQS
ncbi:MAG TPA: hypothetical protein VN661_05725 [Candidatus Acidoferrales bacterium]|nr:hypothetical protein [Candidatus Acidoferrales bacterium]